MIRVFTFIFALFAVLATGAENFNTWQKQMPITFSGYTPPGGGTLTNFPALVIFSNTTVGAGFAYSNFLSPPYADLRFTAGDKTTPLNFEVEKWDTNGNSYAWVQVPILAGTNTQIWAFWGKNNTSTPACTTNGAAWNVNYVGVWHLANGSVLSALDSTSNRNNGVISGSTAANGLVDGAANFAGSQSIASSVNKTFSDFTAETWFKDSGAIAEYERLLDKKYDTGFWVGRKASLANTWGGGVLESSDPYGVFVTLPDGVWHQMVSLRRGSTHYIYGDGGSVSAFNTVSATPLDTTQVLFGNGTTGQSFGGMLDEVRISNIARSSNWIWACYMNMASNETFNTYDPPAFGGVPGIVNSNAVVTITYTTLNGYLASTGLDTNVSTAVFWGTNDPGPTRDGWDNTNRFPGLTAVGLLSTNVVPTASGAKYYYRFFASNSIGSAWASPANTFVSPGPPTVNNAGGAINLTLTSATLQGEVTGGNPTPSVQFYWGTIDQGTNKLLWDREKTMVIPSNCPFSANIIIAPGGYYYRAYASNVFGDAWAPITNFGVGTVHYVNKTNATPTPPYTSWAWAATNIQDAIDVAAIGELVIVTNGVYNTGGRVNANAGTLTNRVVITNFITVRGASTNPAGTIIMGAPDTRGGAPSNGPSAMRCAYVENGSLLSGFTLSDGYTSTGIVNEAFGGGVFCQSALAVLSNCGIASCRAARFGGGAYNGKYKDCLIISNFSGGDGGGLYNAYCYNCWIITNYAAGNGGGGQGGLYTNCVISCNNAPYSGGGLYNAPVYNSVIEYNASWINYGGALQGGSAYNCTIVSNKGVGSCGGVIQASPVMNCIIKDNRGGLGSVSYGGYTFINCLMVGNRDGPCFWGAPILINCTIVSNRNGVFYSGVVSTTNCIIYANSPCDVTSISVENNCYYSCIGSNAAGTNHATGRYNIYQVSPQFRNPQAGDYHLASGQSPCYNTGSTQPWMTNAVDLDGCPRIRNGNVDMGAYEIWVKSGTIFRGK